MNVPKIKLSSKYAKGSLSDRTQSVIDFNKQLFSNIYQLYGNTDYVSVRNIERAYKSFMPEPIYFKLRKLRPEELKKWAGGLITYFANNRATNFKIALSANHNKLHVSEIPTLIHENTHFFDYLLKPKHIKISEKIRERNLKDVVKNLNINYYYNNKGYMDSISNILLLNKAKKETKKLLKGMNPEDKLLVLKSIKLSLETEISAFNETQKYAKQLQKDKRKYKWIEADGYHKSYMFEKKLKIINALLSEIIHEERNKQAQKVGYISLLRFKLNSVGQLKPKDVFNLIIDNIISKF